MLTQQKPQPSDAQVEIVDTVLRIVGERDWHIKPAMYPSGTMLLMVISAGGQMRIARIDRDGEIITVA